MYDVVISGAGPSGSQCAEVLAKAGYQVALIEKDVNWRKPCGGAVHSSVVDLYPELKKLNYPKIRGVVMYSADYHILEFKGASSEYSIIIDRLKLDNIMREAAVNAGVDLYNKHLSFDYVIKNQKKIGIKTKSPNGSKEFHANLIIVADGMSSKLAIKSGIRLKWNINELAIGKCAILEGNHQLDKESVYVYFKPYQGYGWIFPLNDKRFNIGIFTFGKDNLNYNVHEVYQEFVGNPNIKKYTQSSNYNVIWSSSYSFPAEGVLDKSLYTDNIMLIGDAGGFVSPISGEGIQTAVISGKIAAETAIKALQDEDYSKNTLKTYRTNPEIKKIIRNFKQKSSMINFFYEKNGKNLNKMLELAELDSIFREQVINMFAFGEMPSKDFITKLKS
ncbi:MAG: NAD(P)/FAD-dependent oxidoreductase [Promethearchaeota archaeon]|nr:MAG: NAD(P)/FAD-dependent oxidoreductase [Candidatus Lokiarchaeota archaeon]